MFIDDLNLTVLSGRVASEPGVENLGAGARKLGMLVSVRARSPRRRIDILPVTMWDPPDELVAALPEVAARVFVVGSLQRRIDVSGNHRASRIEVVAHAMIGPERMDSPAVRCD